MSEGHKGPLPSPSPQCPVPDAGTRVWVDALDDNLLCSVCQELFTDVRPLRLRGKRAESLQLLLGV
jgi:hypothetical protein